MGNRAQRFSSPIGGIGWRGNPDHTANFCGIAVFRLNRVVIKTGRKEQNRFADSGFDNAIDVGGDFSLSGKNSQIYGFQMDEIGQVSFDGHHGIPWIQSVAIEQGPYFKIFRFAGACLQNSNRVIDATQDGRLALENLHHDPGVIMIFVQNCLGPHEITVAIETVPNFFHRQVELGDGQSLFHTGRLLENSTFINCLL